MRFVGEDLYEAFFKGYREAVGLLADRAAGLDPEATAGALQLRRQLFLPQIQEHAGEWL